MAYPLLGVLFGGILVFSFSRVLLAVSKDAAPAIGLLVALNILVGAALIASGRRVRRRPTSFPLLMAAAAGIIVVGVVAMQLPEKATEGGGPGAQAITLVAQGTAFDNTSLSLEAGAKVDLTFDNKDAGIPHNFALFNGPDASAPVLFRGQLVTGPAIATYGFTAPAPGRYFFHCDVHPTQMNGTVTVAPGGPGGGPGGGLNLTAKNIAFNPGQLTAPPGGSITIHFDNQDPGTPHNVAVFDGSDASAPVLFKGDLVTGPAKRDYTFRAPPPGTYYFHCDVHPTQMQGTLVVR